MGDKSIRLLTQEKKEITENSDPSPQVHQHESRKESAAIHSLPLEVIAQIKSSVAITSLTAAILGLVENSLDAQATKITIEVDFGRGGCVLEDDGSGISPLEFAENGGLGKLYHTSKYSAFSTTYGRDGLFLASLSSLCLLYITSRHHLHRSANSVVFHHSQVLSRHLPAPISHHITCRDHGTKVTVRNLFGNMPVRVKQRSLVLEDRAEQERHWEELKRSLVALLIASPSAVSLRVQDVATLKTLTISERSRPARLQQARSIGSSQPARVRVALSTLTQVGAITPSSTNAWIPAAASSRTMVIKGAISLDPAPTKGIQFLSFGTRPLQRTVHNELYDYINRLFSRSCFGIIEEEALTEDEKRRRQIDRRFKQGGLTKRQKVMEKGVDRWPMFVLNISITDKSPRSPRADLAPSGSGLKAVTDVLDALIMGWLSSHHFTPSSMKGRIRSQFEQSEEKLEDEQNHYATPEPRDTADVEQVPLGLPRLSRGTKPTKSAEERNGGAKCGSARRPYTGITSFNDLSRIKSSNRCIPTFAKPPTAETARPLTAPNQASGGVRFKDQSASLSGSPFVHTELLLAGQLSSIRQPTQKPRGTLNQHGTVVNQLGETNTLKDDAPDSDEVLEWTDPITKQRLEVNARTGMAIGPETARKSITGDYSHIDRLNPSIRIKSSRRSSASQSGSGEWLNGVLQSWKNPVFRISEKGIPQIPQEVPAPGSIVISPGHLNITTPKQIEQNFAQPSSANASKLTKDALKEAKIVAQVDKKFILVSMAAENEKNATYSPRSNMLVAIDQHAADERCKVEALLNDLCKESMGYDPDVGSGLSQNVSFQYSTLAKPLIFRISSREGELFEMHAARFAEWGILFDLREPGSDEALAFQDLVILALPPVIAERSKLEPKVLISLLRTELWKIAEDSGAGKTTTSARQTEGGDLPPPEHVWLRRIGRCPQGILEMINSRACRSAIMFNDALSRQECEDLVKRLSACAFPFQCAHGRPSMVPLVDLGSIAVPSSEEFGVFGIGTGSDFKPESFSEAFSRWKASSDVESMSHEGQ